jgi:hypothetical protein
VCGILPSSQSEPARCPWSWARMRKERKKYQPHDAFTDAIRGAVVLVHYNQRRDSVPTDSRRVALVRDLLQIQSLTCIAKQLSAKCSPVSHAAARYVLEYIIGQAQRKCFATDPSAAVTSSARPMFTSAS